MNGRSMNNCEEELAKLVSLNNKLHLKCDELRRMVTEAAEAMNDTSEDLRKMKSDLDKGLRYLSEEDEIEEVLFCDCDKSSNNNYQCALAKGHQGPCRWFYEGLPIGDGWGPLYRKLASECFAALKEKRNNSGIRF